MDPLGSLCPPPALCQSSVPVLPRPAAQRLGGVGQWVRPGKKWVFAEHKQTRAGLFFRASHKSSLCLRLKRKEKKRQRCYTIALFPFYHAGEQELCVWRQGAEQGGAVRLCAAASSCCLASLFASLFVPLCFCTLNCMGCFAVYA